MSCFFIARYCFYSRLNIKMKPIDMISSKYLSEIIDHFKDTNKSDFINYSILRSMTKAKYSPNIDIHFGLATFLYCHFTSPIRRYADLTVHRTLKNYLHSNIEIPKNYIIYLDITSNHINDTEVLAIDAERKLEDIKKVEFMKNKIGQVFKGIIVSVISFTFATITSTPIPISNTFFVLLPIAVNVCSSNS